jgi:hypothetical protein
MSDYPQSWHGIMTWRIDLHAAWGEAEFSEASEATDGDAGRLFGDGEAVEGNGASTEIKRGGFASRQGLTIDHCQTVGGNSTDSAQPNLFHV